MREREIVDQRGGAPSSASGAVELVSTRRHVEAGRDTAAERLLLGSLAQGEGGGWEAAAEVAERVAGGARTSAA